jgi:hypothetical protein
MIINISFIIKNELSISERLVYEVVFFQGINFLLYLEISEKVRNEVLFSKVTVCKFYIN